MNRCANNNLARLDFLRSGRLRKVVAAADGRPKDFAQRVGTDEAVEHGLPTSLNATRSRRSIRILEAALVKGRGQLDLAQLKEKLAGDDQPGARRFGVFDAGDSEPRSFP